MQYFDKDTFAFLRELAANNDRDWFAENKDRYEESVKEPFLQFINDVGPELRKVSKAIVADPRPNGGSMFRIYRDVRFSKDKSPYKPYASAHFSMGKGVHGPGYYLHVQPGECFLAGGMWMPEPPILQSIRERISGKPAEWKKARGKLDHSDDTLKRPPRGFHAADPMIEDIKRKSFTGSVRLTDKQVQAPDLVKTVVADCRELFPLMKFLSTAAGVSW
jgi:uncharacterized protein (TIGR02453 family)